MQKIFLLSILIVGCVLLPATATNTPVIGVMSIPSPIKGHPAENYSYIPASYVKIIESAGARVVPIPYDASPENITFLLEQVNGVLFIGGGAKKSYVDPDTGETKPTHVTKSAMHIVDYVISTNKNGEHFPLFTVCLGWEILLISLSERFDIFYTHYKDANVQANVKFVPDSKESKLWSALTPQLQQYSQQRPAFLYDHIAAILPGKFKSLKGINDILKITSLSEPVNGGPIFVASAEGREFPIFGHQFHPEKNSFEWKPKVNPPHTPESVEIAQRMARMWVGEARKNNRSFNSPQILDDSIIYNWDPSTDSETFDQVYTFRTVAQDPESWPALFGLKRVKSDPILRHPTREPTSHGHITGSADIGTKAYEALKAHPILPSNP